MSRPHVHFAPSVSARSRFDAFRTLEPGPTAKSMGGWGRIRERGRLSPARSHGRRAHDRSRHPADGLQLRERDVARLRETRKPPPSHPVPVSADAAPPSHPVPVSADAVPPSHPVPVSADAVPPSHPIPVSPDAVPPSHPIPLSADAG